MYIHVHNQVSLNIYIYIRYDELYIYKGCTYMEAFMSSIDLHCAHPFQLLDKHFVSSIFDKLGNLHHFSLTSEGMLEVGSCHRHIYSYVDIYVYTVIYIYTYLYTHVFRLQTYKYIDMNEKCVYIHMLHLFSNIYIYIYIYMYGNMYIYIYRSKCTLTLYLNLYIYVYICIYVYIYTHTHRHIYVCIYICS